MLKETIYVVGFASAAGVIVAAVAAHFGAPWWVQAILAAVSSFHIGWSKNREYVKKENKP